MLSPVYKKKVSALLISAARKREMLRIAHGSTRERTASITEACQILPQLLQLFSVHTSSYYCEKIKNQIFSHRLNFTEDDEVPVMNQKPAGKPQTCFPCTSVAALTQLLLETNLPPGPILCSATAGKKFPLQAAEENGYLRKFNIHASIN